MEELTKCQLAVFQELFNIIDVEQDGSVTYKELSVVLRALGGNLPDGVIHDMINESDEDGNGSLDFNEFTKILLRRMSDTDRPEDLRETFTLYDKDNNGFISAAELRTIFASIGMKVSDEEIEEMIREADLDGDGVLLYEEFANMMTSLDES